MPSMAGVEAARTLGRLLPSVPILIVTLYITTGLVSQAKNAGAKGSGAEIRYQSGDHGDRSTAQQKNLFREQAS
jgi:CheY-like chemotaxis protein